MLGLEMGVLLTYAGAVILVFLLGRFFLWPLKLVGRLLVSSLLGGACILFIDLVATALGMALIPLNLLTAAVVGLLGLPGAVLLLIYFL